MANICPTIALQIETSTVFDYLQIGLIIHVNSLTNLFNVYGYYLAAFD